MVSLVVWWASGLKVLASFLFFKPGEGQCIVVLLIPSAITPLFERRVSPAVWGPGSVQPHFGTEFCCNFAITEGQTKVLVHAPRAALRLYLYRVLSQCAWSHSKSVSRATETPLNHISSDKQIPHCNASCFDGCVLHGSLRAVWRKLSLYALSERCWRDERYYCCIVPTYLVSAAAGLLCWLLVVCLV